MTEETQEKPPETPARTEVTQLPAPKANIQAGGKIQAIVPQNIEEAFRMAEAIFLAGMYPDSYRADSQGNTGKSMGPADRKVTTSRIMIGIQKAMEVGLPPIAGLSAIYIVNSKPTIYGDGVPALLYASGKIEYIKEWTEGTFGQDDYTAYCSIKRKDMEEPIVRSFSYGDAKKAGLLTKTGPWTQYPKRQLQMRARGFAARDGAADILAGLGIYEEVIDIPEKSRIVDKSSLDDTLSPSDHVSQIEGQTCAPPPPQLESPDKQPVIDLQLEEEKEPALRDTPAICNMCGGEGFITMTDEDRTWKENCDCQTKGGTQ